MTLDPSVTVVPPLSDPTIELVDARGLVDLDTSFRDRLTGPRALREAISSADPLTALFLSAVGPVVERGAHRSAALRAQGVALRAAGAADPALHLTADDVELVEGTTESGDSVATAAERTRLFGPETAAVVRAVGHGAVRIVVQTDQQLPAALCTAAAVGPAHLQLVGAFARAHRAALLALPALHGAEVVDRSLRWRVRQSWTGGESIDWYSSVPRTSRPWAGWLELQDVLAVPAAAWTQCRGLVVTVAGCGPGRQYLSPSGQWCDLGPVLDRVAASTPVRLELLAGVPGRSLDMTRHDALAVAADRRVGLAGLRRFRLARALGQANRWNGAVIRPRPVIKNDLARSVDFETPHGPTNEETRAMIDDVLSDLSRPGGLLPGRFAGPVLSGLGSSSGWSADGALAETDGAGPDGRGPGTFVVNFRSGRAFRLHDRLAPIVTRIAKGDTAALARLSEGTRDRLCRQLVHAGVWERR